MTERNVGSPAVAPAAAAVGVTVADDDVAPAAVPFPRADVDVGQLLSGPARMLFDRLPTVAWVYDTETLQYLAVNVAASREFGWSEAEFLRHTILDIRAEDDRPRLRALVDQLHSGRPDPYDSGEWRHVAADGTVRWDHVRSLPVRWHGRPARFVLCTDVTGERATRDALDEVRALSDAVLHASPMAVVVMDLDGVMLRVNPAAEALFGRREAELVGAPVSTLMPGHLADSHQEHVERYLAGRSPQAVGRIRRLEAVRADGTRFPIELALGEMVTSSGGRAFAALIRDVSAETAARRELERTARVDTLTGLLRRSLVERRLDAALREELPATAVLVDLDRFHLVNDGFGSEVGDRVLQTTGTRIAAAARAAGAVVARSGGDEFLVVASRMSAAEAVRLAEQLVTAVEVPIELDPGRVVPQARAGVAWRGRAGTSVHALVAEAYAAARAAKRQVGRKVAVSARGQAESARRSLDTEQMIRDALVEKAFTTVYQPVVRLADGATVGAEALVRWARPEGLVPPAEFIPLAEETGLIIDIGAVVLDAAVAVTQDVLTSARGARRGWRTWVNVSARELSTALVPALTATLERYRVDPAHVGIELTETALFAAEELNAQLLDDVRGLGVSVALDDFGTGYSSLSFLRALPADVVKIDRSFVAGMDGEPGAAAIVRAVVALGASLGLDVVAEGVERKEEADLLRELGCTYAQGWLFGRPEPAAALLRRLGH